MDERSLSKRSFSLRLFTIDFSYFDIKILQWYFSFCILGFNNSKPIHHEMASQQSAGSINNQQILSNRLNITSSSSDEVFRPPSVKDIPELSRENLLNMLK